MDKKQLCRNGSFDNIIYISRIMFTVDVGDILISPDKWPLNIEKVMFILQLCRLHYFAQSMFLQIQFSDLSQLHCSQYNGDIWKWDTIHKAEVPLALYYFLTLYKACHFAQMSA